MDNPEWKKCPFHGRHMEETSPLTVEDLRKMLGEPVYLCDREQPKRSGWCIVGLYYDNTVCLHMPDNAYYEIAVRRGSVVVYRCPPVEGGSDDGM